MSKPESAGHGSRFAAADLRMAHLLEPGATRYVVMIPVVDTLRVGDVVVLRDRPGGNLFVRESDLSIHETQKDGVPVVLLTTGFSPEGR